jgi:hypothetical protein
VVATDVYAWKLLRLDLDKTADEYELLTRQMVGLIVNGSVV